ncbi:hypothetical protein BGZ76_002333 [Entomortierella beljakovae]|nr:hypothetical protein BGZ76_002333 [Entomortierella beljakovae]
MDVVKIIIQRQEGCSLKDDLSIDYALDYNTHQQTRYCQTARQKTYTEFDSKRNETDEVKIKEQLELANQVASLLRHNLAQAVRKEGTDMYSLQLNKDHELGDNETLRQASKLRRLKNQEANGKAAGGGCGSPACCSA